MRVGQRFPKKKSEPRLVNGGGKSVVVKYGDSPEIGKRLHAHQHHPSSNEWTGHGECNLEKSTGRLHSHGPCRLHGGPALCHERAARHEIHIGIKSQGQDGGHTEAATNVNESE